MKGREKSCLKRDDLQSNIGQEAGVVLTHPAHQRGEDLQVFGLLSAEKGEGTQHEREDALQGEGQQTPSLATASGNHHHTFNVTRKKLCISGVDKIHKIFFTGIVPSASQRSGHLVNPEAPKKRKSDQL